MRTHLHMPQIGYRAYCFELYNTVYACFELYNTYTVYTECRSGHVMQTGPISIDQDNLPMLSKYGETSVNAIKKGKSLGCVFGGDLFETSTLTCMRRSGKIC